MMDGIDLKIIQFVVKKNKLKEPVETRRFSSGQINHVYNLNEKYVLKIEGKGEHEILKPAPLITAQLISKGAKVPKILDFDTVEDNRYILMEKIAGNNLSYDWMSFSEKQKEKLIEQLAEQLKIWHSISFDEYCIPIVGYKPFKNLQSSIERLMLKKIKILDKEKLPKDFLPSIEILENFYHSHITELNETGTAVLVHQDIHLENIFCQGDIITGIIDLDWVSQAPRDYELWKIMDVFYQPKYTVEKKLHEFYGNYQMTKELKWLKKYYPELFETKNLANRIRLYYIDPMLEGAIDYANGKWGEKELAVGAKKIQDFYKNSWLDEFLGL